MTDVLPPIIFGSATGLATTFAVLDPSIQNIAVAVIGAVVTITTVVFAYKTAALNKKIVAQDATIAEVKKTSDGMKDELVKVTAIASHATGMIEGKAQEKASQALKAEGVLSTLTPKPPADK